MRQLITYCLLALMLVLMGCSKSQDGQTAKTQDKKGEGLYLIVENKKFGFMDKSGKVVVNPQFDRAFDFSDGLAVVVVGGKMGYIDKTGKYIRNPMD